MTEKEEGNNGTSMEEEEEEEMTIDAGIEFDYAVLDDLSDEDGEEAREAAPENKKDSGRNIRKGTGGSSKKSEASSDRKKQMEKEKQQKKSAGQKRATTDAKKPGQKKEVPTWAGRANRIGVGGGKYGTVAKPSIPEKKNNDTVPSLTIEEQGLRCKKEYTTGVTHSDKRKIVVAYPITSVEFSRGTVQTLIARCRQVHWVIDQAQSAEKPAGMLSLMFHSMEESEHAEKTLKKLKDDLRVSRVDATDEFSTQMLLSAVVKPFHGNFARDEKKRWENSILIKDLPASLTEEKLRKMFPNSRVTIPVDEAGKRKRHALVEYINRETMLAVLDQQHEVEVDGHKLKLRDLMKSDVTPLVPKKILSKVQDLAALRHDLAKDWDTFTVEGRTSLIKNIHMQECQLRVDEQVKQELGLKIGSKWEEEMMKQLRSSSRDIPGCLKHLASTPVAGLAKKVCQLKNRQTRPKVNLKAAKAAAKAGVVGMRKYGGKAERLLLNAKQRAIARTTKNVSIRATEKKALGEKKPFTPRSDPRPVSRRDTSSSSHFTSSRNTTRPVLSSSRLDSQSHRPQTLRPTSRPTLKRTLPPPQTSRFDTKRRRQDSLGDSSRSYDKSPRYERRSDQRETGRYEKPSPRESTVHHPSRTRHHSAGESRRRSVEEPRHRDHSKGGSSQDKYSQPRSESWRSSRSPRDNRDFKSKSPPPFSTMSTRELSRYYSELSRNRNRERSPRMDRDERNLAGEPSNPMNPEAMSLLVGLSKILKKQAVTETVRSTVSQVSTPSSYQSSRSHHRRDTYPQRRNSSGGRGRGYNSRSYRY